MAMARSYSLEEIVTTPGMYFNPQTEVMIVVDDSAELDAEIFNMEEFEGADWVLVSDDLPLDEAQRDEMLEGFQATHHGGDGRTAVSDDDELEFDEDDELEPDPDPDEE